MAGKFDFNQDLENGKEAEREFATVLIQRGQLKALSFNDDNRYDLAVLLSNGVRFKFEIKDDMTASRTGNVGVEFECRGKPSGINVTEADYWVFRLDGLFYSVKTEDLRRLIERKAYWRIGVGGDTGSQTKIYLLHKADVQLLMVCIKPPPPKFLEWDEIGRR